MAELGAAQKAAGPRHRRLELGRIIGADHPATGGEVNGLDHTRKTDAGGDRLQLLRGCSAGDLGRDRLGDAVGGQAAAQLPLVPGGGDSLHGAVAKPEPGRDVGGGAHRRLVDTHDSGDRVARGEGHCPLSGILGVARI